MREQDASPAKLFLHGLDKSSNDFHSIQSFLSDEGIEFGRFELNDQSNAYTQKNSVPDEKRAELIASYQDIVRQYEGQKGYRADIVCLYPEFEHLNFIMKMFGNVHYHFENEYWYFFDGRLGFTFYSKNGLKFDVIVDAGEYIQVPERIWQQCFFVSPTDKMKSMRFFTTSGTVTLPEVKFEDAHEYV